MYACMYVYVCVFACIKPNMNYNVFNLYKLQIGKLQSVQHLHLFDIFLPEFSKALFSMQISSESLVSL